MKVHKLTQREMEKIKVLFYGWKETMILSCLQGYMGRAYVTEPEQPLSASILVGDFCFFAGVPDAALVRAVPREHPGSFLLLLPQHEGWSALIESVYGAAAERIKRYAIKKEPDIFCPEKLWSYVAALPSEYELRMIDKNLYKAALREEWSKDLCSVFAGYGNYREHGLGVAAVCREGLAAGASSYTVYDGGIEIEIDTKAPHRRKGLALACGARLILECLDRGLYPSWDAHDMRSVRLAEKLGYHMEKEYAAYTVSVR